jgi:uncharacterized protein YggE
MHPLPKILLSALLALPAASSADGHEPELAPSPRIVVTGNATVMATPDRAAFTVTVSNSGRDADAVLDANAERSEHMIEGLHAAEVELVRLQTRGVRLTPQWSPRPRNASADWRPEIVGYTASNRIEIVTTELDRVGTLLSAAVEAGANGVDGIRFTLEDDAEARAMAIRRATATALREADVMAEAAGIARGEVLELRLDHAHTSLPQPVARMESSAMMAADVRAVPTEAGEVRVDAAVTITLRGS